LEAVLYHEGYHLMHRHPLGIWVVESLAALLFFLPVLKEWRDLVKTRMEIEADQHAIQSVGKAALAGALARLVSHSFENTGSQGSRASFHGMASSQVRVAHLLGNRSSTLRVTTVSLVKSSAVLWALCLVTML
jgi:Zn-dependent protease with chaperone function